MALHRLRQEGEFEVDLLVTTLNADNRRISMHGIHENALKAQAKAIGLPLKIIEVPSFPDMQTYNRIMQKEIQHLREEGFEHAAFGDIYLEDLRKYRETQLKTLGVKAHFPLWGEDTFNLAEYFFQNRFQAVVVAAGQAYFDKDITGRKYDRDFLNKLPASVDPCGEKGEFHTFCFDGPVFSNPFVYQLGEKVIKTYPAPHRKGAVDKEVRFWYIDVTIQNGDPSS
jgi:uncharacterized protein (TIGR00290 family)